jgi:hypothetical protein
MNSPSRIVASPIWPLAHHCPGRASCQSAIKAASACPIARRDSRPWARRLAVIAPVYVRFDENVGKIDKYRKWLDVY